MSLDISCRTMEKTDLGQVLQIEKASYPQPWSEGIFADCLRVGYQSNLYLQDDRIIGYSIMSIGAGEAHLMNLCLHPDHQGRGRGRQILQHVLATAREKQAETIFLEVRASNQVARNLYLSEGFNEIGQRFNYYPKGEGREDALVFAKSLL